ncbi:hypothetical protein OIU85_002321 [Salix viminalis]|uniref:TCP domain-containing protein n=1 Tax=Salix viminalis TaxID=40686 RepID=A0A9Q0VN50_SALVM|nr:hypothetical protein OIU85_002321 [Salix viminalis]
MGMEDGGVGGKTVSFLLSEAIKRGRGEKKLRSDEVTEIYNLISGQTLPHLPVPSSRNPLLLGDVGFDGSGNIEWQNLLGEAEEAEKSVIHQKLEQIKNKGLRLDPQRNHHRRHQLQNTVPNSRHVGGGGGGEDHQSPEEHQYHHQVPPLLVHHQYLQNEESQQDQNQHLYQRLDTQQQQQAPLQPSKKRSYFLSSPSSTFQEQGLEYARKMGESHHQAATSSRLGIRNTVGEIVEVQGGHIVRSTGRKDRHSKVCTAKGPRDRRVRLSAHTAIQFYDVQDRLGYDRPSKAVDWLIKKAKASIDELAELPAWDPTTAGFTPTTSKTTRRSTQQLNVSDESEYQFSIENAAASKTAAAAIEAQNMQQQMDENPNCSSGFFPPSLDSDAIADTIKTFFPMGASTETSTPTIQFQNYPPDLLSRTSSQSQDLRLSLQSFQEPILLQHQAHHQAQNEHQVLLSGATAHYVGLDGSSAGGGGGGGLFFNTPVPPLQTMSPPPLVQPFFGQNQFFSQRGPLQSSNTPSVLAWIDPSITPDHHHHHHQQQIPQIHHQQTAISGIGFTASGGEFYGFRVPARIQGEEEEHDGIHNKPSSASSDTRH